MNNTNNKWIEFHQWPTNSIDCLSLPKMQSCFSLSFFFFYFSFSLYFFFFFSFICSLQKFYVHFSNSEFDFFFSVENFNKNNCEQCKDIRWWSFVQFGFIGMHISISCLSFRASFKATFGQRKEIWSENSFIRKMKEPTIVDSSSQCYMFFCCSSLLTFSIRRAVGNGNTNITCEHFW